jgi:hypothetical protein
VTSPCAGPPIPPECAAIKTRIDSVSMQIRAAQEELKFAAPQDKGTIVARIRRLSEKRAHLQTEYATCTNGRQPVSLRFQGTLTATVDDPRIPPRMVAPGVDFVAHFTAERDAFTVFSMADVTFPPYEVVFAGVASTQVTVVRFQRPAVGAVYGACHLVLRDVLLRFDHSFDLPIYEEDSDLTLTLGTHDGGSPVDGEGRALLVGSGVLAGGFLAGKSCAVELGGQFTSA